MKYASLALLNFKSFDTLEKSFYENYDFLVGNFLESGKFAFPEFFRKQEACFEFERHTFWEFCIRISKFPENGKFALNLSSTLSGNFLK